MTDPIAATDDVDPHGPARSGPVGGPAVTSDVTRLVEWEATARRLRRSGIILLGGAVLAWVVSSLVARTWGIASLADWIGLALLAMVGVEIVVAGGSAVRGLLRAGERGERLSSGDVGLFPRLRRRSDQRGDGSSGTSGGGAG